MYPSNPALMEDDRNEKLQAARKKLKQFQNRRRSTSRSHKSGTSAYGNDENQHGYDGRHHQSHQRLSGDEIEKMGDGRPLSECCVGYSTESLAESTASTTKAPNASRAARRASAASSRYLETPEPIRISIAPEHQQEMFFRQQQERQQGAGSFHHDEQRSPFQRIQREFESSEIAMKPVSKPMEAQSQHLSLQNELSVLSSSSGENDGRSHHQLQALNNQAASVRASTVSSDVSPKSDRHRSGDEEFILNMDAGNAQPSAIPSFDAYRPEAPTSQHSNDVLSVPVVATDNLARAQQMQLSGSTGEAPALVTSSLSTVTSRNDDQYADNSSLQLTIQQQQTIIEQLAAQLQQLHSHYSHIHTAYVNLIHQQQQQAPVAADDVSREMEELRKQLQLHLHTVSVLVDEKTDLQSQLRQAMEIANQKHFETEELQGRLKANRERLEAVERELESHGGVNRNLEDTLKRQATELERLRKESAQWQARATEAQQDRSEMNAKLKIKSREVDDLGNKLRDVEKQLHLKDIYIQQLTGGPGALQQQQALAEELEQQRRTNVDLYAQLDIARKAVEQWRWDSEQIRERYETFAKQLSDSAVTLNQRLELTEKEKHDLQLRCEQLDKELASLAGDRNGRDSTRSSTEDLESLKVVLNEFEQGLKTANDKAAALESQLSEKEMAVKIATEQLSERDRLVRQLTDQLNEKYQHDDSARSLLEQLHNEKATVSRAVAQNIELKKQLVELQEKFVEMTEGNMETANKLESAERQLASLKETLGQKDSDSKTMLDTREQELASLKEQLAAASSQNFERSHMEDRLRHYEAVQKHFDSELERCQREIGHLKVENADLTQRLLIVNDANKNLQMERQRSAQHLADQNGHNAMADEMAKLRVALVESENLSKDLAQQLEMAKRQENGEELKRQLVAYEQELADTRRRLQHLTTENAELHRIMEQNAEDENQNTIRVELHQALNRSTALSNDNEQLRQRVQELEALAAQDRSAKLSEERSLDDEYRNDSSRYQQENSQGTCSHSSQRSHQHLEHNGDDHSSVCSEHTEQRREAVNSEAFEHMRAAMEQLQQRFAKAMNENADLSDQNQQLEHLITQLQSETETIGEYITIYQHQRRTIRERLREKEDYVAKLAREKEDMQAKLTELQQLVVRLLRDHGSLRQYPQAKPVHGRPAPSAPSVVPRKPRALSQTLVDEVSGEELPIVSPDAVSQSTIPDAPVDPVQANGDISPTLSEDRSNSPNQIDRASTVRQLRESTGTEPGLVDALPEVGEEDATAERILRLLTEMRRPDLVNALPPVDRSLHCKYCTGRLMML